MPTTLTLEEAEAQLAELRAEVEHWSSKMEAFCAAFAMIGRGAGRPDIAEAAEAITRPDLKVV